MSSLACAPSTLVLSPRVLPHTLLLQKESYVLFISELPNLSQYPAYKVMPNIYSMASTRFGTRDREVEEIRTSARVDVGCLNGIK